MFTPGTCTQHVQYDPTTSQAYLVTDQMALWGKTALWGKESVYGNNAFVEGSTALWGKDSLTGSTALWGKDALWGSSNPQRFTALWGRDAFWSTATLFAKVSPRIRECKWTRFDARFAPSNPSP